MDEKNDVAVDFRGACSKGDLGRVDKPKLIKKAPELVDSESESNEDESNDSLADASRYSSKAGYGPGRALVESREVAKLTIGRGKLPAELLENN